jgi:hypothetical protein
VTHEILEQRELPARKVQGPLAAPRPTGEQVQTHGARLDGDAVRMVGAPRERADAGEQLLERERLGQVVVRAGVEGAHLVRQIVARGEHEHGQARPPGTDARQHFVAVHPAQRDVEQDELDGFVLRNHDRVLAVVRGRYLVAGGAESALEHVQQPRLVFHCEHAHRPEYTNGP